MMFKRIFALIFVFAICYTSIVYWTVFVGNPTEEPRPLGPSENLLQKLKIDCQNPTERSNLLDLDAIEKAIYFSEDQCATVKRMFTFNESPRSQEESEYPLAYGMLVYKNIVQFLFMLSAFYEPQNEYCIVTSNNSEIVFNFLLNKVSDCFPNVHLIQRGPITWGSYEIINSTYTCLQYLSGLKTPWKYYQYLSGFDAPLKTNLEMVQMFKLMNDSANYIISNIEPERLKFKNPRSFPLPLLKASLSALLPRVTVDAMVKEPMTRKVLDSLNETIIADENFWGTMLGNKPILNLPGSIDGWQLLKLFKTKQIEYGPYYMSRYQIWGRDTCKGKLVSGSCCYGIGDLAALLSPTQRAPVGHKFYLDFQPEAFFCVLKEVRKRAIQGKVTLMREYYRELPHVELHEGVPFDKLKHPDWIY